MKVSIYQYLNFLSKDKDSKSISEEVFNDVKNKVSYLSEQDMEVISDFGYIPEEFHVLPLFEDEIQSICKNVLSKCHEVLPQEELTILIFPSFSPFIIEEMNGCSGFSPETGKMIIISLNTEAKGWRVALTQTLAHEYHHTAIHHKNDWVTLGDTLIYEGLAENFREDIVGGPITPYIEKNSEKTCSHFWEKLRDQVENPSYELYQDVFFGSDTYPQWLGYSLGYYIIKALRDSKEFTWKELTDTPAKNLMNEIISDKVYT